MPHLSQEEHAALQAEVTAGDATINISGTTARRFFLRVSSREVHETVGHGTAFQRSIVWAGTLLGPALLIACCAVIALTSGFWAAVGIPLIGMFWAVLAGLNNEDGDWQVVTVALIVGIGIFAWSPGGYTGPLLLFIASIWIHRITFLVARAFLLKLVMRSHATWEELGDHLFVKRRAPG